MYSDNEGSYLLKGVAFFVFGRWKVRCAFDFVCCVLYVSLFYTLRVFIKVAEQEVFDVFSCIKKAASTRQLKYRWGSLQFPVNSQLYCSSGVVGLIGYCCRFGFSIFCVFIRLLRFDILRKQIFNAQF